MGSLLRQFPARRMSVMVALQEEIEDLCSYDTARNIFSIRQRHCAADRVPASSVPNNHDDFNFDSRGHMTTFNHNGNILIPAWFALLRIVAVISAFSRIERNCRTGIVSNTMLLASRPEEYSNIVREHVDHLDSRFGFLVRSSPTVPKSFA